MVEYLTGILTGVLIVRWAMQLEEDAQQQQQQQEKIGEQK